MKPILVQDIIKLNNLSEYKLHLGSWNGEVNPLDVFVLDFNNWKAWNEWKGIRDDFNRQYIFSLIDYYHEPNKWLFGGIFKVRKRYHDKVNENGGYEVELIQDSVKFIGRLIIEFKRTTGRGRAFKLENYIDKFSVSELLRSRYSGETFCGYENINHDFTTLETVFRTQKLDWKGALENVKGVYQIIDKSNGKKYIGSAYGEYGIWSRWACYIGTGHGWNDELTTLINEKGFNYARKNFRFCLLEYRPMKTDDSIIINRESFWKEALMSRGKYGYNHN